MRVYRDTVVSYTCEKCGYQWEDYLMGIFICPKCGRHHLTVSITSGPNLKIAKLFHEKVEEEWLMLEAWKIRDPESGLD